MLQCLKKAHSVDPTHPDLHIVTTKYLLKCNESCYHMSDTFAFLQTGRRSSMACPRSWQRS